MNKENPTHSQIEAIMRRVPFVNDAGQHPGALAAPRAARMSVSELRAKSH
jgi:hypothetical protein